MWSQEHLLNVTVLPRVKKVKQSHNTMEAQGGQEVELLLIHDLGTRWG
jgi:hypothetical protein